MVSTRTWLRALSLIAAILAAAPVTLAGDMAYRGRLMGPDGKPYFGIVRLGFSLHREAQGGKPLWGETRFVYIEEGTFLVRLGERAPIPAELDLKGLHIAMSIPGGGEFFREPLKPIRVVSTSEFVTLKETTEGKATVVPVAAPGVATSASRERVKPKLGAGEAYADHVGGHGGTPFFAQCPKGYVVTGARGGAGKFVDGFQFVCSPLE